MNLPSRPHLLLDPGTWERPGWRCQSWSWWQPSSDSAGGAGPRRRPARGPRGAASWLLALPVTMRQMTCSDKNSPLEWHSCFVQTHPLNSRCTRKLQEESHGMAKRSLSLGHPGAPSCPGSCCPFSSGTRTALCLGFHGASQLPPSPESATSLAGLLKQVTHWSPSHLFSFEMSPDLSQRPLKEGI